MSKVLFWIPTELTYYVEITPAFIGKQSYLFF